MGFPTPRASSTVLAPKPIGATAKPPAAGMAAAGEEAESSAAAGERPRVPFARGGPVFVPFMVGPISTVPEFMSSTLGEVQVPNLPDNPSSSIRPRISV